MSDPASSGTRLLPDDVERIGLPTPFAVGDVNVYVLDGASTVLVDCGPRMRETERALVDGLASLGHRIEDIDLVLLTHQHHDHVGLAASVQERAGAEVVATRRLAEYLGDFEASMDAEDAWAVSTMRRHGIADEMAESVREIARAVRRFGAPVEVDRTVEDGDVVAVNGRRLRVHERSGHTPTDTIFHDENDGLLIAGDHLLERISSNALALPPVGEHDSANGPNDLGEPRSLLRYLDSLRSTAALDVSLVLPGHGDEFRDHREVVAARETMHANRANAILERLDERPTAANLVKAFWPDLPLADTFLGLSEVLGHLQILRTQGRVHALEDDSLVRWERADT